MDDNDGGGEVMVEVLVLTDVVWQQRWCDGGGMEMWMCWRLLEKEADGDGWRQVARIWPDGGRGAEKLFGEGGDVWLGITATNKMPLREPIPLKVVAQESVATKVYTRRPKVPKTNGSNSKPKIAKSVISNKTKPGTSRGSNTSVASSSSSSSFVDLRLQRLWGYGDYQIGNITISRVYYVEGLGHNLFSVGQFCDSDLEVAFRKHTCFVHNLKGIFVKIMELSLLIKPCENTMNRDDWDRLFQPMFDEYFNTPTIAASLVPFANAPRAVDLADLPVSTLIDQDASSTSIPSAKDQQHSTIIS
nr:integrase, catalytic region, zinc finger, CCHC-type, peptidase aspartic, catalytic [Tanacetum cinerariifolium]GFA43742.1 integrase, catalytic region, zinc finger, CCHC-type, peptidase aspartic, catalytic [Tanacetum cinerariifolium]